MGKWGNNDYSCIFCVERAMVMDIKMSEKRMLG